MKILVAENAGFCAGVRRAVKITEDTANDGNTWYTFGPLVHNSSVVNYFSAKGVKPVLDIKDIDDGGIIIRAHGVPPETVREVEKKELKLKDATCPLVKRVHDLAVLLRGEGYEIIIFGDINHPEVQGILGYCDNNATVISNIEQAHELLTVEKRGVISQTTRDENEFYKLVNELHTKSKELRIFNTICTATKIRQEAARNICQEVDLMLVIGDKNSSNTNTLARECMHTGVYTLHIQSAADLRPQIFKGVSKVGVTAGASTPDWIIKEVVDKMTQYDEGAQEELKQDVLLNEENPVEEVKVEEQEVQKEKVDNSQNGDENFAKMEAEMAEINTIPSRGDVIKGTVVQVLDDEVMVDVGGKSEGVVRLSELSVKDVSSAKELVKVGDEIEVLVLKWNDDGTILLSKKRVDAKIAMDKLEEVYQAEGLVQGTVIETVKGGLLVDVGVIAFLPASHVEDGYVKNLEEYVGKTYNYKIIEFNRNKKRGSQIVVSRKELVEAEKARLKEEFWGKIEIGQVHKGKVKRIVDYGAFIDLGGFEGLLHVSEIDHVRVEHPSDVLSEGEEIDVYILDLDREKQRVSLSRKKLLKSPWEIVLDKYDEGDIIEGTVVRMAAFGAFVEIEPGVDGLVHISQLADHRVEKPADVVSVNEKVKVKILSIDPEEKRIGLSIKEAAHEQENDEVNEYLEKQGE